MSWIAFDAETATELAARLRTDISQIAISPGNPLEAALRRKNDCMLLMPGKTPDHTLLLHFHPSPVLKITPHDKADEDAVVPYQSFGILGLGGEAEYLDEAKPRKAWWKIWDRN